MPGLERVIYIGTDDWDSATSQAERVSESELQRHTGIVEPDGPDQHPVHVGHHGIPEGRDPSPQHPQQRLLRRGSVPVRRAGPGGIRVPFYHCFGMVMGNLACTSRRLRGDSRSGLRSGCDAGRRAGREVRQPLRRPDDVHRRVEPTHLRGVRPVERADRDHGGLPLSSGPSRKLIASGIEEMTICRNDGDLPDVDAQNRTDDTTFEQKTGTVGGVRPIWRSRSRGLDWARPGPARAGRRVHDRGYSVMLSYWGGPTRRLRPSRTGGCTQAPRGHARRRLRRDHWADQGHGHPGGENVYPREIEEHLHPPGCTGCAGHPACRREVRRGALCLDPDEGGG